MSSSGRSTRPRDPTKKYNDDNPLLDNMIQRIEAAHKAGLTGPRDDLAALAAGLPPATLADFERGCCAIPDKLRRQPLKLVGIRNHYLAKQQRNPSKFLSLADAVKGLEPSYVRGADRADAEAVYECLTHHGYLNWGVLDDHPNLPLRGGAKAGLAAGLKEAACATGVKVRRQRIVVIGAGASGLAAARQLTMLGHEVTILEARERTGGRVHTVTLPGPNGGEGSADLGAMVVTGTEGNPIVALAKMSHTRLHRLRNKCSIYGLDGKAVPESLDEAVEKEWNAMLDRYAQQRAYTRTHAHTHKNAPLPLLVHAVDDI